MLLQPSAGGGGIGTTLDSCESMNRKARTGALLACWLRQQLPHSAAGEEVCACIEPASTPQAFVVAPPPQLHASPCECRCTASRVLASAAFDQACLVRTCPLCWAVAARSAAHTCMHTCSAGSMHGSRQQKRCARVSVEVVVLAVCCVCGCEAPAATEPNPGASASAGALCAPWAGATAGAGRILMARRAEQDESVCTSCRCWPATGSWSARACKGDFAHAARILLWML